MSALRTFWSTREEGSAVVEYALLLVLIAVVCLLALEHLGVSTSGGFSQAATSLAE